MQIIIYLFHNNTYLPLQRMILLFISLNMANWNKMSTAKRTIVLIDK